MSYLRLVRFTLAPASVSKAEAIANDLIPAIKQQLGCIAANFFGGGADGESGLSVNWETQEHANAASAIIGPRLQQHLAGNISGQPEMHLFPVIAS